jgi:hypothetical protein
MACCHDVMAGAASKLALRGAWEPQTPEAKRFLATYSPMFSKYTKAGFLLVGLDLFKKILQSFFLSFIGAYAMKSQPRAAHERVRAHG